MVRLCWSPRPGDDPNSSSLENSTCFPGFVMNANGFLLENISGPKMKVLHPMKIQGGQLSQKILWKCIKLTVLVISLIQIKPDVKMRYILLTSN